MLAHGFCTGWERVEKEEVGWDYLQGTVHTWQLLGLAVKGTWLAPGGPTLAMAA